MHSTISEALWIAPSASNEETDGAKMVIGDRSDCTSESQDIAASLLSSAQKSKVVERADEGDLLEGDTFMPVVVDYTNDSVGDASSSTLLRESVVASRED